MCRLPEWSNTYAREHVGIIILSNHLSRGFIRVHFFVLFDIGPRFDPCTMAFPKYDFVLILPLNLLALVSVELHMKAKKWTYTRFEKEL